MTVMTRNTRTRHEDPQNPYRMTGVRPGDRLRLLRGFMVRDYKGRPTGKRHRRGELWTVLPDSCRFYNAIWLAEPDGSLHTWDDSLLKIFSIIARAPTKGMRVRLRALPPWVQRLPQDSQEAFRYCLHHFSRVEGVDDKGLIEVSLGRAADRHLGGKMNSVHIEAEFLTPTRSTSRRRERAAKQTPRRRRRPEPTGGRKGRV